MLNRRELITAFLGAQVAQLAGCSRPKLPPRGKLFRTRFGLGHQIRDKRAIPSATRKEPVGVAIVGGGMAGLSAGWRLKKSGFDDFVILELEDVAGGTAKSGSEGSFQFPWGAHYVPAPLPDNHDLIRLFDEIGIVDRILDDGTPVIGEQYLCREPEERVFYDGCWHEGLYPYEGASERDLQQLKEFQTEIARWVDARDSQGKRMFAVPMATGSDEEEVRELDSMSMAQWMDEHGWDSHRLRWLVDYSCRDDYGLTIDRASAWAGVFYFAARVGKGGEASQDVITWPSGNGMIAKHLSNEVIPNLRPGVGVVQIKDNDTNNGLDVTAIDAVTGDAVMLQCDHVIFAAPQMLSRYILATDAAAKRDVSPFQYGSWLVANVHLSDRPSESTFPMAWDNVLLDSKSLGYVTSTHQLGVDHGPTVLTWYYPFADTDPKLTRQKMLALAWEDWADLVLSDLSIAHPDISDYVEQLDVMCWGHAMVQARPGFLFDPRRIAASEPCGAVHFAGTDLSGIPLFEEAFSHGIRAAEEVMRAQGHRVSPLAQSPRT